MAATKITPELITDRCRAFMRGRRSVKQRFASFDLCYSYFYLNQGQLIGNNLALSCMQLWSFLASWGMVTRGNELQREKSYVFLEPVILFIHNNPQYYNLRIGANNYKYQILLLYQGIKTALGFKTQKNQKILVTKIMLGVYACFPAFDTRFCETFDRKTQGNLTEKDIDCVVAIYQKHTQQINRWARRIHLLDFNNNPLSSPPSYTAAKVIDMIGFTRIKEQSSAQSVTNNNRTIKTKRQKHGTV